MLGLYQKLGGININKYLNPAKLNKEEKTA